MEPPASIVIPTRDRTGYLDTALGSLRQQAARAGAEVVVVDDGAPGGDQRDAAGGSATREIAALHGARYVRGEPGGGLNAARNLGVAETRGALLVFLDDDVRVRDGWLEALLAAAREHPASEVLAGRIVAALEGPAPHTCGRELPPVTTLDLGEEERETPFAWGSNMTIRRSALERVGPFDETLGGGGDEQEWQERLPAPALYVPAATVEHRRAGDDARLRSLSRAAFARGRGARRFDARRGTAPPLRAELLTLVGCVGHVVLRRCPAGVTMVAHSAGRAREALAGKERRPDRSSLTGAERSPVPSRSPLHRDIRRPLGDAPDFLSGASGTVGGVDRLRRRAGDGLAVASDALTGRTARLALAARRSPPRRQVLALSVVRPANSRVAAAAAAELLSSRHDVELRTVAPMGRGKFESLNALLAEHPADGRDWLLVVDDDVELPRGFADRFLFLCERFGLTLAQPAHRRDSHAAWQVTRRHPASVVRETRFVEIGPVTAFAAAALPVLLPFPELRMGWGLDVHWAAVAQREGWRCGVVDAVPVRHRQAPAGGAYSREQAIEEAREFLATRPYVTADEAQRTLATHSRW